MGSKKKLLTSVAALTTTAALLLGGTFAWQSISQTALNESTDAINPGGRLHNDIASVNEMDTMNHIYVENFTDEGGEDIYARIRLEEYMELVMNYGVEGVEVVKNVAGVKTPKDGSDYSANDATRQNEFDYTYELHLFDENAVNATDDYWTWTLGTAEHNANHGSYMPTFNKNKDSLAADQNGRYKYAIGGITERTDNYDMTDETGFVSYTADEETATTGYGTYKKTAYAIYDNDGNQTDELAGLSDADLKDIIANGTDSTKLPENYTNAIHLEDETHIAKRIGDTNGTISMADWLELIEDNNNVYDSEDHGGYWVYDTDGWVYWSSPIKSGTTTGPLLEGFSLNHEMNDTWYYAINVEAQFITADDLGAADGTGFYDESGWYDPAALGEKKAADFEGKGQAPTEDALKLLELIGVDTSGDGGEISGGEISGGEISGGEISGGEAETLSFTVTVDAGDNPEITNVDSTPTLAYNGEATAFTFAFGVDDTDDTWALNLVVPSAGDEDAKYVLDSSGGFFTTIRENNRDKTHIATWYPDENKLSVVPTKTLENCNIEATKTIGEGSASYSLHIASITSTPVAS